MRDNYLEKHIQCKVQFTTSAPDPQSLMDDFEMWVNLRYPKVIFKWRDQKKND